jgi:hypothetical protein
VSGDYYALTTYYKKVRTRKRQYLEKSAGVWLACFLSTMFAGRTLSISAPRASNAFTFSRAISSGMMIASNIKTGQDCKDTHETFLTGVITPIIVVEDKCIWGEEENTYRALAIVAIEIPVDPTVPSKIREPVYGCKSPSRSASSITLRANSQREGLCKVSY